MLWELGFNKTAQQPPSSEVAAKASHAFFPPDTPTMANSQTLLGKCPEHFWGSARNPAPPHNKTRLVIC